MDFEELKDYISLLLFLENRSILAPQGVQEVKALEETRLGY